MVRLLIGDGHVLVRDGIAALVRQIAPEVELELASSRDEVISKFQTDGPFDVLLMDLGLFETPALEGALRVAHRFPSAKTVLMAEAANEGDILRAITSGFMGFLPKSLTGRALVNALRLIASGEAHFPAALILRRKSASGEVEITQREREILLQLVQGLANKEIAVRLKLEEATVKSHLRSLGVKLGARNRTDIALRGQALLQSG